ncbi:MAG TPA: hypothetical protein VMM58_13595 [Bacteroidota bacterium]|nr:hypothetical protein [Bacteroidota bacterium]
MTRRNIFIGIQVFAVVSLIGGGCNDPLPTYVAPSVTIATIVPAATFDTVMYAEYGDYFESDSLLEIMPPTPVVFNFFELNQYQETLYGAASVSGQFEISVAGHPEIETTVIPITAHNIQPGTAYDSKENTLTLDPNQDLWLQVSWNLRDGKGNRVYREINNYVSERYFGPYGYDLLKITSIKIHVLVTVQLYDHTSAFSGEQDFDIITDGRIKYLR